MKKLTTIFAAVFTLLTGGYAASEYYGYEFTPTHHQKIDPGIRKSPGGWRSYSFWHRGYSGGK